MIAFGRVADNKEKVAEIGRRISDELKRAGLVPKWDGDIEKRIEIPSIDWKRRY
jgi:hypothetical protein